MEKQNRIIYLDEISFTVDTVDISLSLTENTSEKITHDDLKDEGQYYSLLLDKESQGVYKGMVNFDEDLTNVVTVNIPKALFNEAMWEDNQRIDRLNKMSYAGGWNILIADEKLNQRLNGVLPHIDLAGHDFIVDWRLKELRKTDQPGVSINLKRLEMDDSGENYLCMFDKGTGNLHQFVQNSTELPQHVTVLSIPYELRLDPVGVAREYGMKDVAMLSQYPIQDKLSAKEIPLSETRIPEILKANQKKAEKRQQINQRPKIIKRKKGKGLS